MRRSAAALLLVTTTTAGCLPLVTTGARTYEDAMEPAIGVSLPIPVAWNMKIAGSPKSQTMPIACRANVLRTCVLVFSHRQCALAMSPKRLTASPSTVCTASGSPPPVPALSWRAL